MSLPGGRGVSADSSTWYTRPVFAIVFLLVDQGEVTGGQLKDRRDWIHMTSTRHCRGGSPTPAIIASC